MDLIERSVAERVIASLEDNTVLFRIGVPPPTDRLRDRLRLVFHPSTYRYEEIPVTLAEFRETLDKKEQGNPLSPKEREILFFGTLSLVLAATNSTT